MTQRQTCEASEDKPLRQACAHAETKAAHPIPVDTPIAEQ
jgi:hypothetical protein